MSDGWCPFADKRPFPKTNFSVGNKGRLAVVLHVMDGGFEGSIDWMRSQGTSAHFCISKTGKLVQLVSINDTAYTNGLSYQGGQWFSPRGPVEPTWPLLVPPTNPNFVTVTIEHEGRPGEPLTPEMRIMQALVLHWIAEQTGLVYVTGTTLIGHFNLDNVGRARCPGPAFDFAEIADDANAPPEPAEPDYRLYWGDVAKLNKGWRIPKAWMRHYQTLGRALAVPFDTPGGTTQEFVGGFVRFSEKTGAVAYLPEDQP